MAKYESAEAQAFLGPPCRTQNHSTHQVVAEPGLVATVDLCRACSPASSILEELEGIRQAKGQWRDQQEQNSSGTHLDNRLLVRSAVRVLQPAASEAGTQKFKIGSRADHPPVSAE